MTQKAFAGPEQPLIDDLVRCVHCGLCLNYCPTYRVTRLEPESPRGRIYLARAVAEGRLELNDDVIEHWDYCLACRTCEAVCPSGVPYGRIIERVRVQVMRHHPGPLRRRLFYWLAFKQLFPHLGRLRFLARLLRLYQRSGLARLVERILPGRLREVHSLMPPLPDRFFDPPEVVPARGERRFRVGILSGCVMPIVFAETNWATVRVLAENGCEVVIPRNQGCCGALNIHNGERDVARRMAKRNIAAFEATGVDYIVVNSAGCCAAMKEYGELFSEVETEWKERAEAFAARVLDVNEFLVKVGFRRPTAALTGRVTYQDPCHLAHAQRIRSEPRQIIRSIPGIEFVEMRGSDLCCGSAGIYALVQPELSRRILDEKMGAVRRTGADLIVTANPGCQLQLLAGVRNCGLRAEVLHVVELLDRAYQAEARAPAEPEPVGAGR
jgi:glycolate oxidase iron-sulfur subunit